VQLKIESDLRRANWRTVGVHLLAAAVLFGSVFLSTVVAQTDSPESIRAGESLFRGTTRLANKGPACATCHAVASLPFPSGGTMGPDLTHEYSRIGLVGLQGSLQTLFFPTMAPLYANRPLTTDEQGDLLAFLKDADQGRYAEGTPTIRFGIVAVIGCLILLGVTWTLGRRRVRSVRHALLKRAMPKRERLS
jgi:hypothetical protein